MKNLLTVLKKLGKKMTSQDINGTNLVTVVDDIANKYTGGSGGGEGGSGCDCTLVVGSTYNGDTDVATLDKTWQDIHDAVAAGKRVVFVNSEGSELRQDLIYGAGIYNESYFVSVVNLDAGSVDFITDAATGYPYRANASNSLQ